ncbi:MAG: RHS repeat-associated core domain-containing protein [Humidesulfovibrio sp.]|uniref:RHS repeat-associated core domain-containing protein n=1 Tax=Humidesulfovibrio sp. TaxID=2910988 RepID=UPI0027F9BADE|nr:RHS repeat-associated core domain-containing protein [Humidesulfovibrio sp.]MDQ7834233.1 RHS repeat-associated core domain-containing protein [Humidesulfovibrio sp.]
MSARPSGATAFASKKLPRKQPAGANKAKGVNARLPIGFAGGLFDADTGLTRFVWRDYDADTGRFTALDPLGKKGGDNDWYGYCVDDPVNRVDVWGLDDAGNKPYFCNWAKCDENGTLQGDYIPIGVHPGAEPIVTDFSVPLPKAITVPLGDNPNSEEVRIPLGFDITTPFRIYDNWRKGK